jgi:chromosomal replication initiation ATPase DnaA
METIIKTDSEYARELMQIALRQVGVDVDSVDPMSRTRKREFVDARMYVFRFLYRVTNWSLERIGESWRLPFDHTSVINGLRRYDSLSGLYEEYSNTDRECFAIMDRVRREGKCSEINANRIYAPYTLSMTVNVMPHEAD